MEVGLLAPVWFRAESEADRKAISLALPGRLTITVTLTATDPGGLSAPVTGEFLNGAGAVKLTFDWAVEADPTPGPEQFTVNVVNGDGSAAGAVAVSGVPVNGKVVTLALASALEKGQTVTVDYAYDTPLRRGGGGGDYWAPCFTGQAVDMALFQPPGPVENFAVSVVPGKLDVLATWDAVEGATSYKLRWRKAGGEFEADNAVSAWAANTGQTRAIAPMWFTSSLLTRPPTGFGTCPVGATGPSPLPHTWGERKSTRYIYLFGQPHRAAIAGARANPRRGTKKRGRPRRG